MTLKVLAALAAMLIAGLGAGGVFVMLLQSGATVTSADLRAIRAAYDAQDLAEALRITARSDETLRRSLSFDLALDARAFRMARGYSLRYLDIAPADDPYVPKIRAILEASPPREP